MVSKNSRDFEDDFDDDDDDSYGDRKRSREKRSHYGRRGQEPEGGQLRRGRGRDLHSREGRRPSRHDGEGGRDGYR